MYYNGMAAAAILVVLLAVIDVSNAVKIRRLERRAQRRKALARRRSEREALRFRSEYLRICNEFAAETQHNEPLRKAVGLFSDEAAQEKVR